MSGSLGKLTSTLAALGAVRRDERRLVGVLGGVLFVGGGIVLVTFSFLPGVSHAHRGTLLALAALACTWGALAALLVDWERAPRWVLLPTSVFGLALVALAIASSGGAESPAWIYLFPVVVFAGYFYAPATAYGCFVACVAVQASPLLYDARTMHSDFLALLAVAAPAYVLLGGAIVTGKRRMWELRHQAERLAAEQGALRRVATAVVGGESPERIYERVSFEIARLVRGDAARILKLEGEQTLIVAGSWADHPGGRYAPGTQVAILDGSDLERALQTGRAVRVAHHDADSPVAQLGYSTSIVAPVWVSGGVWGLLAVTASAPREFSAADDVVLMEFGNLLATAIASLEDRAKLAMQASSDPLTGLANHRTLQDRLVAEAARAVRHHSTLAVAVLDIDHFKAINDSGGHELGDETLTVVAQCLQKVARVEDTLGRMGGDEFAWLLPETTREQALVAVERARRLIHATVRRTHGITVSAGICDTSITDDPAQLIGFADGALYWSKAHGRDQCWVYDAKVVAELSAQERAERLERSQALAGLRALARAIDAKDTATRRHSERVADLVLKLARTVGWSPERAQMLREAALVHDVGKIGVPDAVLLKPGRLTDSEREQIRQHAELSARIVADVLAEEQMEWIRTHHERPDGTGYPRALRAHEIPEGGALLAAADAWDVMTVSRPYSVPRTLNDALLECIELVGMQFSEVAVGALMRLHAAGELSAERELVNA